MNEEVAKEGTTTQNPSDALHKAIYNIQQDAPPISKSAINPHFKSNYADLADVWDAIAELMGANGLIKTETTHYHPDSGHFVLVSEIIHVETGQLMRGIMPISTECMKNPQRYGSFNTYMRRYSIISMLGLITEDEDDDGNQAASPANPTRSAPAAQKNVIMDGEKWMELLESLENATDMAELKLRFEGMKPQLSQMSVEQRNLLAKTKDEKKAELENVTDETVS